MPDNVTSKDASGSNVTFATRERSSVHYPLADVPVVSPADRSVTITGFTLTEGN